jgi:dihydroorotate dehydrogenase
MKIFDGKSVLHFTASGATAYGGGYWPWEWPLIRLGLIDPSLFAHIEKSFTLNKRTGNYRPWKPWDCIRPIFEGFKIVGFVNSFGLTNPGFDWWIKKIGPRVDSSKQKLVGSIFGELNELRIMTPQLNNYDFCALEVNVSCPNDKSDILSNKDRVIRSYETVKARTRHDVIAKLSVSHEDSLAEIINEIDAMVAAYDINSVFWDTIFPGRKSPLAKYGGGGVSGKIAQKYTWPFAQKIRSLTEKPILVPVWEYGDLAKLRALGKNFIPSWGSIHICGPWIPTSCVRRDKERINEN